MKYFLCFVAGGGCGALAAYLYLNKKYNDRYNRDMFEYRSLREDYEDTNQVEEEPDIPADVNVAFTTAEKIDYAAIAQGTYGPSDDDPDAKKPISINDRPHPVDPDNADRRYKEIHLDFYDEDHFLVEPREGVVMDIESTITMDMLGWFDVYEPDMLYVQDDTQGVLYVVSKIYACWEGDKD